MKIYTKEEIAKFAGVPVKDVQKALDDKYLTPGLLTFLSDDRDKILGNRKASDFIKHKGDRSKLKKWSGTFGRKRVNGYVVGSLFYRGYFCAIASSPNGTHTAFLNSDKELAMESAITYAGNDTRFIKAYGSKPDKGFAAPISLTYRELMYLKRIVPKTSKYKRLHTKIDNSIIDSIERMERGRK